MAELERDSVAAYQPYLVVSAHFARAQGDLDEARRLLERAIDLTEDAAVRAFASR